jgi:hypothetical protein
MQKILALEISAKEKIFRIAAIIPHNTLSSFHDVGVLFALQLQT